MTSKAAKLLATASIVTLTAVGGAPAWAAGTTAGTPIVNNVNVNYSVGGVAQTQLTASNTTYVDRLVTMTMSNAATTTSVAPGQTQAVVAYKIVNNSNAPIGLGLSTAAQASGGSAAHGGNTNYLPANTTIWVNTNGSASSPTFDPANSKQVSFVGTLAADATQYVFVRADTAGTQVNGDIGGVLLQAQALEPSATTTAGAVMQQNTGARVLPTSGNTVANTIFGDTAGATVSGSTDNLNDGKVTAANDYTVSAPVLTVTKLSSIIWDPITKSGTNAKAVPGATILYCVVVANSGTGAPASNITISDPLPSVVAWPTGTPPSGISVQPGMYLNGSTTVTNGVTSCNLDGTLTAGGWNGGSPGTVTGTIASLPTGAAKTLYFTATIN